MKKILLVATVYRIGERIYPIIPEDSAAIKKTNIAGSGRYIVSA